VGADLSMTLATKARFFDCDLKEVNFSQSSLDEAIFEGVRAHQGNFTSITGERLLMTEVQLPGASFPASNLKRAQFFGADLTGANFRGSDLFEAGLGSAILKGADLTGCSLYGADLYRARVDQSTSFAGSDLNNTCLTLDGVRVIA
jgi:uncharacterized protein YjbI with pentapeptide repeats